MDQDLQEIVAGALTIEAAERYLNIYVGECTVGTWRDQIGKVWVKVKNRPKASAEMRNILAHAILVPMTDKTIRVNGPPENFLHQSMYFRQLKEHDWFSDLQKVAAEDLQIDKYRAEAKSLGIVDPIEFQPYCRQGYNWLYAKAEEAGTVALDPERVARLMKNLVYAYGGAVICSIFTNHSDWVAKVTNWRTGYFFEKAIFKVYKPEQVMSIKRQELSKTNTKLVKKIRHD